MVQWDAETEVTALDEALWNRLTLEASDGVFPLSTDTMLLSDFVRLRPRARVADLGCGCGALGLLLCARSTDCTVTGIELLPRACAQARANIAASGLSERMRVVPGDLPPPRPRRSRAAPPPAPRPSARRRHSAPPRPGCSSGAAASRWCSVRRACATSSAPSGPPVWSRSACGRCAPGPAGPSVCCCWRPFWAAAPASAGSRTCCWRIPPASPPTSTAASTI